MLLSIVTEIIKLEVCVYKPNNTTDTFWISTMMDKMEEKKVVIVVDIRKF